MVNPWFGFQTFNQVSSKSPPLVLLIVALGLTELASYSQSVFQDSKVKRKVHPTNTGNIVWSPEHPSIMRWLGVIFPTLGSGHPSHSSKQLFCLALFWPQ